MENQTRTLGSVINSSSQQGSSHLNSPEVPLVNVYLTNFSINCAYRFPDVTNLDAIDYEMVKNVSRFSFASSQVAIETWIELTKTDTQKGRLTRAI